MSEIDEIIDKLYAGWISKVIGVRHGAPVEGWSAKKIKEKYGVVDGYVQEYKNFAADDDTNVPIFLIKVLDFCENIDDLTSQDIGNELLNYAPYEHGFFWWGGYGVSTEHTAYLNLINGIKAPESGSARLNGIALAEQIGGQIFIDSWGLICPNNPQKAAKLAEKASRVTHDGDAVYGAIFVACCISIAYAESDIDKIIDKALKFIPSTCHYAEVIECIRKYYQKHPDDWEKCYEYIYENFGYDKYAGNCHIIPNIAVMILALLYGEGDFDKTLNIGVMCGWDTDCNVGNIATIMGVRGGTKVINYDKWYSVINDLMICSSTLGDLNILDNSKIVDDLLSKMARINNWKIPDYLGKESVESSNWGHFEYEYSTHNIKTRTYRGSMLTLRNCGEEAHSGKRSLKIEFQSKGNEIVDVYRRTYYFPNDFSDSRYNPSFAPLIYPGQAICVSIKVLNAGLDECYIYASDNRKGIRIKSEKFALKVGNWNVINWEIPSDKNLFLIDEIGIELHSTKGRQVAYIDDFYWYGDPQYRIDFSNENVEDWRIGNNVVPHFEISQFSRWKGNAYLEDGAINIASTDIASIFTGNNRWENYCVQALIVPIIGEEHYLNFRVQGAMRSYAVGFMKNKFVLLKNCHGYRILREISYDWNKKETYKISVCLKGNEITVNLNDKEILKYIDQNNCYMRGSIGLTCRNNSRMKCNSIIISKVNV